jgi:NADH-quinone oxidoreductase subunit L
VMNDIKRVVAYSTISQLGYMMLGLGVGGVAIGIFHLFTHAFFKALLFLGAGSVNHSTGTFDMRLMGGLRKYMPWTYITFVLGALSLAGIWPLAGFWSKDEILIYALEKQPVLFALALITVFMTAFYIFRVVFMTFGGEYRGGAQESHGHDSHYGKPHESGPVMVIPLVFLAIMAVIAGSWNITGQFGAFMGHGETHSFIDGLIHPLTQPLPWIALLMGGLGILLAYAIYSAKWVSAEKVGKIFKPFYITFSNKYWLDKLYEDIIVRIALIRYVFAWFQGLDSKGVDGAVNGIASSAMAGGKALRRAETGQLQLYGLGIGIGVLVIVLVLYLA